MENECGSPPKPSGRTKASVSYPLLFDKTDSHYALAYKTIFFGLALKISEEELQSDIEAFKIKRNGRAVIAAAKAAPVNVVRKALLHALSTYNEALSALRIIMETKHVPKKMRLFQALPPIWKNRPGFALDCLTALILRSRGMIKWLMPYAQVGQCLPRPMEALRACESMLSPTSLEPGVKNARIVERFMDSIRALHGLPRSIEPRRSHTRLAGPSHEDDAVGESERGVSMLEAAELLCDNHKAALRRKKEWLNQRSVQKPTPIGYYMNHKQKPIYAPAAMADFVGKVEGLIPGGRRRFIAMLVRNARPPRPDKPIKPTSPS